MINIQEITIWSESGNRLVNRINLVNFYGYKFDGGSGYVDYNLIGTQDEMFYAGTIEIPEDVVQRWGESDDTIYDYVIQTLGLIKL